jgi:hypothetical protein
MPNAEWDAGDRESGLRRNTEVDRGVADYSGGAGGGDCGGGDRVGAGGVSFNRPDEDWEVSGGAPASGSMLDAGGVAPSKRRYVVTHPHAHKTLKTGDVVVMVCTPQFCNLLLRTEDMTLHELEDEHDQYVHLVERQP